MNVNGECRILKDDRGICKIALCNRRLTDDGEEQTEFMRIFIGFKKGSEPKNREKINIKNGFLTFFSVEVEENGEIIKKYHPKVMVLDYETIEEGIDELIEYKPFEKKATNTDDNSFGSWGDTDDLPF